MSFKAQRSEKLSVTFGSNMGNIRKNSSYIKAKCGLVQKRHALRGIGLVFGFSTGLFVMQLILKPKTETRGTGAKVQPLEQKQESDVMIVGYNRGGTTFLGDIIGVRQENFYMYEPLQKINMFGYFFNNSMCSFLDNKCNGEAAEEADSVKRYLTKIYSCNFQPIWNILDMWMFAKGRGITEWKKLPECNDKLKPSCNEMSSCPSKKFWCLSKQVKICKTAKSKVTKLVRIGMDIAGDMLRTHPKLKIIYLIRDPRAIMVSRFKIWNVLRTNTTASSKSLCDKMEFDYRTAMSLSERHPDRVFTLFYEDLVKRPVVLSKEMFDFLGYEFSVKDEIKIKRMTARNFSIEKSAESTWNSIRSEGSVATAQGWRQTITHGYMRAVNAGCSPVFRLLNYKLITNINNLQDFDVPVSGFM